jgi:hypothetical protein
VYWLAGGLSPPLPLGRLRAGHYRLTVYAWDWSGNTSALDYRFSLPLARAAGPPSLESGPLNPRFDYDETGGSPPGTVLPPARRHRHGGYRPVRYRAARTVPEI